MTPDRPTHDPPPEGADSLDDTVDAVLPQSAAFLAGVRPFRALSSEILRLLHSSMVERSFAVGEPLMRQRGPGTSLMVVASGEIEVSVEEDGQRHVLKRAHAGAVVGEMALLTGEPRSASVTAITPVRAWVLGADRFHELAARHPKISALLTVLLARRLGRGAHDALTGKQFDRYRIVRCLGRGGMSVVYEAEDARSPRRVALKMMSHRLLYDPRALERFKREAEIVESFDHPNIARTYGRFEAFRTSFIVMEFCEGIPIDGAIAARGRLPDPVVRRILGQVSGALAHAHDAGIVHRDIKPSNIMATRDGSVKLMDFGLAGRLEDEEVTRRLLGTPRYMAPEQMAGQAVTQKSDLFALGHVAYEMLSGAPLFRARDLPALQREVIACYVPDLDRSLPGASSELREVIGALLRRRPDERHLDRERLRSWAAPVDFASLEAPSRA